MTRSLCTQHVDLLWRGTPPPRSAAQLLEPPGHAARSSALGTRSAGCKSLFSQKSKVCASCKSLSAGLRGRPIQWRSQCTLPPSGDGSSDTWLRQPRNGYRSDYCNCNQGATGKQLETSGSVSPAKYWLCGNKFCSVFWSTSYPPGNTHFKNSEIG